MKHRWPEAGLLFGLLITPAVSAQSRQSAAPDGGLPPETVAVLKELEKSDIATSTMEAVDNKDLYLSSRAYRAIQAIEVYRRRVQWRQLTPAERVFDNYNVQVNSRSRAMWLKGDERETCYEIVLWPRRQPGEKVIFDVPARLGRSAVYAVRKSDYKVIRTELDDPKRWGG